MNAADALLLDPLACPIDGIRLVEASAGTGKTWTICALVLRLLVEKRLAVQQILVVTFTNAATAELRERLRARIGELRDHWRGAAPADDFIAALAARARASWRDEELAAHLAHALQSFDEAAVFTIHGFCKRALDEVPLTAGVPTALELLQDDSELRREAVHDFWRRRVAGGDAALAAHLLACKDSPQTFDALLQRHLARPLARLVWPPDIDAVAADDTAALLQAQEAAHALWQAQRDEIVAGVRGAAKGVLNGQTYNPKAIDAAAGEWDELLVEAHRPAPIREGDGKAALFGIARLREKTNKGKATPAHPFFDAAQTLLDRRAARLRALQLARLRLLRELIDEGARRLRETKRERRVVAFDDLLHNLWQRLAGGAVPGLAAALRARYPAALIDEFQDTDPLQFEIFRAIHGDGGAPLFLVGDPKQAIYRFRNADLHAYLGARRLAASRHTLPDNQRSDAALIDAVNAVFAANDAAFMLPGLEFRPAGFGRKPRPAFVDASAPQPALALWRLPAGDDGRPLPKAEARRRAVAATAAEIARLLTAAQAGRVHIGERALEAGDIAVLVRSHGHGRLVRAALAARGVASVEVSQASVFASVDAEELERVLAAVCEPGRETLLRSALATVLHGGDAAAIAALDDDAAALLDAVQRYAGYRDAWRGRGVAVMLRQWMAAERVAERLLAGLDGERRLTNLLHLVEALHQASAEHAAPEALLRWLQAQRQERRADEAAQLRLESDRHLVQIVTVHKSKGLEYGIVFCPLLWDGYRKPAPSGDGIALHGDDGALVIDFRAGLSPDFDAAAAKARRLQEDAAEDLRLLYVALTRAVHRCVLVCGSYLANAGAKSAGTTTESGRSGLNWLVAGQGRAPADWLASGAAQEDIEAAWDALAARVPHAIAARPWPAADAPPFAPEAVPPEAIAARSPPRTIPPPWRIGSFSSLMHGAVAERAAVDHDLRAAGPATPAETEAPADADDILRFPRGAAAGECLHAVFERVDFADAAQWPVVVADVLHRHGPALATGPEAQDRNARRLLRLLHDVLERPLPVGTASPLVLARVPRSRRIAELEFHLPVDRLEPGLLDRALAQLGYPVPRFGFADLSGFVTGFVDLVFEHDGRVFVLDWKSNHLGNTPADYADASLAAAMAAHGYHLQALLYSVAVARWLRRRGGHGLAFGGAIYLFVRGVRPGWTTASGTPSGFHFEPPDPRALAALGALLGEGSGA
jgi:exodeoxyribonuclease V beta subunit